MEKNNELCGCGKPLISVFDINEKKIGVTHETYEDEDYHLLYFSTERINERIKQN